MTIQIKYIILLVGLFINNHTSCQTVKFSNECDLVKSFIDSADRTFFIFKKRAVDSSVTIFDINGLLYSCFIRTTGGIHINIINSGEEFDRIKHGGIFKATTERFDYFVLTKEKFQGIIGYRLYQNISSGNFYRGYSQHGNKFYLKKKSTGWF